MKALFLVFFCNLSLADSMIYKQILINKPEIDKIKAKQIAHHIYMVYNKYKIPRRIYAAILMQESNYKLTAINNVSKDYCMAQINEKTAKLFKFNIKRLMTDMRYCIEAGAIVLSNFQKRYGDKEITWFTRYNSSKPSQRKIYFSKIARWMSPELRAMYE